MRKSFLLFLIYSIAVISILGLTFEIRAENTANQVLTSDASKEPVAIETTRGDVFVTYILKEDENKFYVRNLDGSIEGEVERAEVKNIRKPTAGEILKTQEILGMVPEETTVQETRQETEGSTK